MAEVTVNRTPKELTAAAGLLPSGHRAGDVVGIFRIQNRGSATFYRYTSATAPSATLVRGFRHPDGSVQNIYLTGQEWVWTARPNDMATIFLEPAPG